MPVDHIPGNLGPNACRIKHEGELRCCERGVELARQMNDQKFLAKAIKDLEAVQRMIREFDAQHQK